MLALFNKAVRKVNSYLKAMVQAAAEQSLASRSDARRVAKAARGMAASGATLDEDLAESGREALGRLEAAVAGPSTAVAAASALLLADADLMEYAVPDAALPAPGRGAPKTVSVARGGVAAAGGGGGGIYGEGGVASKVAAAAAGASEQSSAVARVLAEAAAEHDEAKGSAKKKKRPRILGGGFNEKAEKGDGRTPKKKNKKTKELKKPEGKYKNM